MCCVLHTYAESDVYSGANAQKKNQSSDKHLAPLGHIIPTPSPIQSITVLAP